MVAPQATDDATAAAYRRLGEPAPAAAQPDRIRALFAELLTYDAAEVRDALGVTATVLAPAAAATAAEQHLADATATGLTQLGHLVRRHPRLAEGLRYELSGLAPAMIVGRDELAAILATARTVGATVGGARYSGGPLGPANDTVVELGGGPVRLLLTTPRPADLAAPVTW